MAKRGPKRRLKRLAAPKVLSIKRKGMAWLVKPSPGPHPKEVSIPLAVFLRDYIGVAETAREARKAVAEGKILVDGRMVKDYKFPLGMGDVISIPALNRAWRIVRRRYLEAEETDQTDIKLLHVRRKYITKGGRVMIGTHDGRNLPAPENIKVGDTVVYSIAEKKIKAVVPLEVGVRCVITSGRHAGKQGVVQEIVKRGQKKEVLIKAGDEQVMTLYDYVMPVEGDHESNA